VTASLKHGQYSLQQDAPH